MDSRVNTMIGIRHCRRGRFDEAFRHLRRAVERVGKDYTRPRDAESLYYLGVALRGLGAHDGAVDAFSRAAWDFSFHSSSHYQLAELSCREGEFDAALAHLKESLAVNCGNVRALTLEVVVLRKLERRD
jgi:Flp pilus assembly protein TadD